MTRTAHVLSSRRARERVDRGPWGGRSLARGRPRLVRLEPESGLLKSTREPCARSRGPVWSSRRANGCRCEGLGHYPVAVCRLKALPPVSSSQNTTTCALCLHRTHSRRREYARAPVASAATTRVVTARTLSMSHTPYSALRLFLAGPAHPIGGDRPIGCPSVRGLSHRVRDVVPSGYFGQGPCHTLLCGLTVSGRPYHILRSQDVGTPWSAVAAEGRRVTLQTGVNQPHSARFRRADSSNADQARNSAPTRLSPPETNALTPAGTR